MPNQQYTDHRSTTAAPYRNNAFPIYVVQALPRDPKLADIDGASVEDRERRVRSCGRDDPDHPCPGTGPRAASGVPLKRRQALHAINRHFIHANASVCRFATHTRAHYASDLVFDVDAHAPYPTTVMDVDGAAVSIPEPISWEWYRPFIEAAVWVGRRIFDYLVGPLSVDPRLITTSVTRQGCRVTVDWRAFGPRRLWEILAVLRWIEAHVFGPQELAVLGTKIGAALKIDGGIFEKSDLPFATSDGDNAFRGPWLRPLGALHHKSGNVVGWSRVTPVPHDRFRAEDTAWLTRVSRSARPDVSSFPEPSLFIGEVLAHWPEARHPLGDAIIEGVVVPAEKLVDLFERDLVSEIDAKHRASVHRARQRALGTRQRTSRTESAPITQEHIDAIAAALGAERGGRENYRVICPRCHKKDATIYGSGWYQCFRCNPEAIRVEQLAADQGLLHLLPTRPHSTKPYDRIAVERMPTNEVANWPEHYVVERPTYQTIDDARTGCREFLDRHLDAGMEVIVLAGGTGTSKTTTIANTVTERELVARIHVARDDAHQHYVETIPGARSIFGMRAGVNCTNDALAEVRGRKESVGETLCSVCPDRQTCEYQQQWRDIERRTLVMHHAYAPLSGLKLLDVGADLIVIDEDPFDTIVDGTDVGLPELALMRCRRDLDFGQRRPEAGSGVDVSLADEPTTTWTAPTPALEAVISALGRKLAADAVVDSGLLRGPKTGRPLDSARAGSLNDLDLTRHLFADAELRRAVVAITEDDLEAYEAARRELLHAHQLAAPTHRRLPILSETAESRTITVSLSNDSNGPLAPWVEDVWCAYRAESRPNLNVSVRPPERRRPLNILDELVDGLRELLATYELGRNRTSPIQMVRDDRGRWSLLITKRRPIPRAQVPIVVSSATIRPEALRLMFGEHRRVAVWAPTLPKTERRIVIADGNYGVSGLTIREGHETAMERLYETIMALVAAEYLRTGLPVGILGPSRVINEINERVLGARTMTKERLSMPFSTDRAERFRRLHELTRPHHYLAGYAGGVMGSNDFCDVLTDGRRRFIRSLIVVQPIPPLNAISRQLHGLYAGQTRGVLVDDLAMVEEDVLVDWTITPRTVAFEGTERDGFVTVAQNVPGFVDPLANELLHRSYEAVILQLVGRMRGNIPDPIDPSIEPRVHLFGAVAIPGWPVDEVIDLDDLRERVGLARSAKRPVGRPPNGTLVDQLRGRWKRAGVRKAVTWLYGVAIREHRDPLLWCGSQIEAAGLPYWGSARTVVLELYRTRGGHERG